MIKAVWQLLRLEHGIMYGIAVIAGMVISSATNFDAEKAFFGFLTALFLQASAFALNDYFDYEVDIANRRLDRPLVRGELKKEHALFFAIILAPAGLISALKISYDAFLFAFFITAMGYAYDVKLKEFGVAGNVYIAASMAAPFLFGGVVAGLVGLPVVVLSAIAFVSGLAREIMKGIEDVEGDALRNVRTVARVKSISFASRISAVLFLTSVALSLLPLTLSEFMDLKYIIPVAITDAMLISISRKLISGVSKEEIGKLRKDTLKAMFIGLIAFTGGAF
jgi:geranylgeranylglycerol-phosphate geranylgeranyltransferase